MLAFMALGMMVYLPALNGWAADKYPSKPVQIIVSRATGGASDIAPRGIQPYLQKALGVSIVIINVPGAGGIVGTNRAYDSPADGYTLLQGSNSDLVRFRMFASQTRFGAEFLKAFIPIAAYVNEDVDVLCVNKSSPYKTFADILAKAKKDGVNVGIGGALGSNSHLVLLLLEKYFGGKWTIVPFQSSGESAASLLGNHIDAGCFSTVAADPNNFRLLAQDGAKRISPIPDVPTFVELGQKALVVNNNFGFFVKVGTDPAIVKTLEAAVIKAANDPGYKKWAVDTKWPTGEPCDQKTWAEYLRVADQNAVTILPILEKSLKELQQGKSN